MNAMPYSLCEPHVLSIKSLRISSTYCLRTCSGAFAFTVDQFDKPENPGETTKYFLSRGLFGSVTNEAIYPYNKSPYNHDSGSVASSLICSTSIVHHLKILFGL